PALITSPVVVLARLHQRLQRNAQGLPALGVEHALEVISTIEALAELQPAPLAQLLLIAQNAIGVGGIDRPPRNVAEARGMKLLSELDQVVDADTSLLGA